jgi:hypothetical protein
MREQELRLILLDITGGAKKPVDVAYYELLVFPPVQLLSLLILRCAR